MLLIKKFKQKIIKMSLFYALISKNFNIILSEYTDHTGNFQQITRILLYKLKDNHNKIGIIRYNKYIYSYITEERLIFLCISDNQDNDIYINDNIYIQLKQKEIQIIFSFLNEVKNCFYSKYNYIKIDQMKSYEIVEFDKIICSLMNYYNNKPNMTTGGIPIDAIFKDYENVRIDNINGYFGTEEIMNIIIIRNDLINTLSLTNKNRILSAYNCKKELFRQIKICLRILGFITMFFILIFLMIYTFGKESDFN